MKGARFSILRSASLLALAVIFLYSASVQEVHYLFVSHHTELNEHCDHHLHAQTNHVECNLCKIELGSFVQSFQQFDLSEQLFSNDLNLYSTLDVHLNVEHPAISPRGPPAIS